MRVWSIQIGSFSWHKRGMNMTAIIFRLCVLNTMVILIKSVFLFESTQSIEHQSIEYIIELTEFALLFKSTVVWNPTTMDPEMPIQDLSRSVWRTLCFQKTCDRRYYYHFYNITIKDVPKRQQPNNIASRSARKRHAIADLIITEDVVPFPF